MKTLRGIFRSAKRKMPDDTLSEERATSPKTRMLITKDLLARSPRIAPDAVNHIYRIDDRTVVKTGDIVSMSEAHAMRFVREKTNVPVPRVLDAYANSETGHVCIVMDYIDGVPLDEEWDTYNTTHKEHLVVQLKDYMNEL